MKKVAISIVFNGQPHLQNQDFPNLLSYFDEWIFVEGASKNVFCTSWCKAMPSQYVTFNGSSIDRTVILIKDLQSIYGNRIKLISHNNFWEGKVQMFNSALSTIDVPCYLWEIDIDEYWTARKLYQSQELMQTTKADSLAFACDNYLRGEDIVVRGEWGEGINSGYTRFWNYKPGMKFISHEPPVLQGIQTVLKPIYTPRFKHLSYYYEKDVKFKSLWYGGHEHVYDSWSGILQGKIKLPTTVENFFKHSNMPPAWRESIITYA